MLIVNQLKYQQNESEPDLTINYLQINAGELVECDAEDRRTSLFFDLLTARRQTVAGQIVFDDEELISANRKGRVAEWQGAGFFYPGLSVRENLCYFGGFEGLSLPLVEKKANWFSHYFDIKTKWLHKAAKLTPYDRIIVDLFWSLLIIPRIFIVGHKPAELQKMINEDKIEQLFKDIQATGTIIFVPKEWIFDFKGPKNRLIFN